MKLAPNESLLTGSWELRDGKFVADEVCSRIDELVRQHLRELGRDTSGWDVLYRDPLDERLWELTYPRSDLHGGGPPQLRHLSKEEANAKYGRVAL